MDIIEKVRICGYSNKFFMKLKFSTKSVSVKMYAHQVRIEAGRYQKLEDNVRICLLCDSREIECDKRRLFFNFVQKIISNFKNCNSEKQFLDILSTNNEVILKNLVQFIYNNRQRWQAPDVSAELAKSHLRVYTRDMFIQRFYGAQKTKIFLAWHLYTRQLACEPQTGSLAYFPVAIRNGTKKTNSSLDRSSTSSNMQAAAFAVPLSKDKQCKKFMVI